MSGQPNGRAVAPPGAAALPPSLSARLLEDVIFTRVAELIDLPRLYDLEAMLALLIDNLGASAPAHGALEAEGPRSQSARAQAIAKAMVDRALLRVARTSRKWTHRPPPEAETDACDICGSSCVQEQSTDS